MRLGKGILRWGRVCSGRGSSQKAVKEYLGTKKHHNIGWCFSEGMKIDLSNLAVVIAQIYLNYISQDE